MIIKRDTTRRSVEPVLRNFFGNAWRNHPFFSSLAIIAALSSFFFFWGTKAYNNGDFGRILIPIVQSNVRIPFNFLKSMTCEADHIELDIKHTNYMKLCFKRKQALQEGILHVLPTDWVPAHIRWNDKNFPVDVRLKGNYSDNWGYTFKWAFQVKVKGDETIMGFSKFTLKHPRTRGFFVDWFLYKMLHFVDDNMAIRLRFAHCAVNGRALGIYLVEEQFAKELVQSNNRPNSVLFKIWNRWQYYNADSTGAFSPEVLNEQYTISPVYPFKAKTQMKDEYVRCNFLKAKNVFEAFRRKKIKTHQAFDAKKIAVEFAVLDLFGHQHASAYANMGLYFNPVTNLIEPVGYDEGEIYPVRAIEGEGKEVMPGISNQKSPCSNPAEKQLWYDTFFEDTVFFKCYIQTLALISKKEFLDSFFVAVDSAYQRDVKLIYKTFPGYRFEGKKILYDNQNRIERILDPTNAVQANVVAFDPQSRLLRLKIGNLKSLPIVLKKVSLDNLRLEIAQGPSVLNGKRTSSATFFHSIMCRIPRSVAWSVKLVGALAVEYSLLGMDKPQMAKVCPK